MHLKAKLSMFWVLYRNDTDLFWNNNVSIIKQNEKNEKWHENVCLLFDSRANDQNNILQVLIF